MDSEQHNKYVGFSFLVYSAFQIFFLVLMVAWFYFIFSTIPTRPGDPAPMGFFGFFFAFILIFQLIFTAPAVIAAYAVLTKKKWARIASIIGAVMSGMSVPIGTAACVYALWFFLGDQWKEVYGAPVGSEGHSTLGLTAVEQWTPVDEEKVRQPTYEPKPGEWR